MGREVDVPWLAGRVIGKKSDGGRNRPQLLGPGCAQAHEP